MSNLASNFIKKCIEKNIKVNIAESCTGGLISSRLVSINNASKVLDFSFVSYSNNSKNKLLNVPNSLIKKFGAVSEEVAKSMVENLSSYKNINLSLAVTGIAGPKGGSLDKPVGLVYHSFFIKIEKKILVIKKFYKGSRNEIINSATDFTLLQAAKLII